MRRKKTRRDSIFVGLDVENAKLEKYIEGFNYVYQYYDKSIAHERNFGRLSHVRVPFILARPHRSWAEACLALISKTEISFDALLIFVEPMKIILDCQIINEDTLVALELQTITPFRFHFHKLWLNHSIRQILSPSTSFDLNLVLNLTHSDVNGVWRWILTLPFLCRTSRICTWVIHIWKPPKTNYKCSFAVCPICVTCVCCVSHGCWTSTLRGIRKTSFGVWKRTGWSLM